MRCRALVDEAACLAHGDCAQIAPETFQVGEVAVVVGDGDPERVIAAAEACPAAAITVIDAETGETLYS